MRKIGILISILLIVLSTSANAFDGNRKGFVFGGAAVFSPYVSDHDKTTGKTITDTEYGISIITGYGFSPSDIITWDIMLIMTHDTFYGSANTISKYTHYSHLKLSHFFKYKQHPLFVSVGIGRLNTYHFPRQGGNRGLGISTGVGYQIEKHIHMEFNFVLGNSLGIKDNIRHQAFLITVRFLAF